MFLVFPTKLSYQDHIAWLLHHRYTGELEEGLSIIHGNSFFFHFMIYLTIPCFGLSCQTYIEPVMSQYLF